MAMEVRISQKNSFLFLPICYCLTIHFPLVTWMSSLIFIWIKTGFSLHVSCPISWAMVLFLVALEVVFELYTLILYPGYFALPIGSQESIGSYVLPLDAAVLVAGRWTQAMGSWRGHGEAMIPLKDLVNGLCSQNRLGMLLPVVPLGFIFPPVRWCWVLLPVSRGV